MELRLQRLRVSCGWLARRACPLTLGSLGPHAPQLYRLLYAWEFRGKNTAVGCHFLLQGIFPTQGLNKKYPNPLAEDGLWWSVLSSSHEKHYFLGLPW